VYTPQDRAWYQLENRNDVLIATDIQISRELTKEELFVLESSTHKTSTADEKVARILYLMQRDLLGSPIASVILERKSQRECFYNDGTAFPAYNAHLGGARLTSGWKLAAWLGMLLWLVIMVAYILYFAIKHPSQLQRAWLYTLYVFVCFDAIVISTMEVVITHVWIPYIIKADMQIVRDIMASTIEKFNQLAQSAVRQYDSTVTEFAGRQINARMVRAVQNQLAEDDVAVPNIAEFFFVSARLSMYFSDLPESKLALTYATMLPPGSLFPNSAWYRPLNKSLKEDRDELSATTNRLTTPAHSQKKPFRTKFSFHAIGRCFVLMFKSYIFSTVPTQDLLLQMILVVVFGIIALISFELYKMMPYLAAVPILALILLYFVIKGLLWLCRSCARAMKGFSLRSPRPAGDTSDPNPTTTSVTDVAPPDTATPKPSRAVALEAQRRALINNNAFKRGRVAPNPPPEAPANNLSTPSASPREPINANAIVMQFANESHYDSKSEDSDTDGSAAGAEEKMGIEDVL